MENRITKGIAVTATALAVTAFAGMALLAPVAPAEATECVLVSPAGSNPNDAGTLTLGGADSSASIFSTACGFGATVAGGSGSSAFGWDADASGANSQSTAIGSGADASGTHGWHTAIGTAANASGDDTDFGDGSDDGPALASNIAIGRQSDASGDDETNIAIGYLSKASGSSIAIGTGATATGSIAIGMGASAGGDGTAVGDNASAIFANSAAFGTGAAATRAGQQVFGTGSNTYTMSGLASQASRAAQSGPTYLVTTDADGNLATSPFEMMNWGGEISRVGALSAALAGLHANPRATGDNHLSGAIGTYNGEFGMAAGYFRNVGDSALFSLGIASSGGSVSGNAGVTLSW